MLNPSTEIRQELEKILGSVKVGNTKIMYYTSFNDNPKSPFVYLSSVTLTENSTKTNNGWNVSAVFDVFMRGTDSIMVENIVNAVMQQIKPNQYHYLTFPSFDFLYYQPLEIASADGQDEGGYYLRRMITLNFSICEK